MRFTKMSGTLGLVAIGVIASPSVMAQDSGWYAGLNVGQSKAKIDDAKIRSSLLGDGFTGVSISDRDKHLGFKLFGGYEFNKYFALEGGYFDLGKFGFTATTVPYATLKGDTSMKGLNFDAVLKFPMTEKFSVFGRAGLAYTEAKDTFTGTSPIKVLDPNPSKRAANFKFGAGLQYDFTESFGMRAEAERYRVNDAIGNKGDIDMVSLGILVRFGRGNNSQVAETAAPVAIPAPAPVVAQQDLVIVPVPEQTQQYCTILDIQFEVDQDDIQAVEKEKLGVLGTFLTKYPGTTAVIEGYTDNVGTPEHNLKLSQDRADNVVKYLVNELHIAPTRLSAVGYGDTRPIADNSTDEGKRMNRRIDAVVACVTDVAGLTVLPARMTMALAIEFDLDKAEIKPQYRDELREVADFLKAHPKTTAAVEGHTGNATPDKSVEISQLRAQNVVNYLVDNFGISRSRLSAEGFGQSRRVAYNTSVEGRQENRRVNIIINYPPK